MSINSDNQRVYIGVTPGNAPMTTTASHTHDKALKKLLATCQQNRRTATHSSLSAEGYSVQRWLVKPPKYKADVHAYFIRVGDPVLHEIIRYSKTVKAKFGMEISEARECIAYWNQLGDT